MVQPWLQVGGAMKTDGGGVKGIPGCCDDGLAARHCSSRVQKVVLGGMEMPVKRISDACWTDGPIGRQLM
jgi:hypothetical protein